jgi:putative endopeptidase
MDYIYRYMPNKTKKIKTIHNRTKKETPTKTKSNVIISTYKDNFYQSVNNSWFASNHSTKRFHKNMFTKLQDKVDKQILNTIKNHIIKENNPNAVRCRNLYISLINWNDDLVTNQIYNEIKILDEYRKYPERIYEYLTYAIKSGIVVPIDFGIINDIKRADHYIAAISESGLVFLNKYVYTSNEDEYVNTRNLYKKFINGLFEQFFGKEHMYSADDAFSIECLFAKKMYTLKDLQSATETYNIFTNKTAKNKCGFDMKLFLQNLGLSNVKRVNIINPKYVKNAIYLLEFQWTSKKWVSYWVYKLLFSFAKFHSKLYYYMVKELTLNIQHDDTSKSLEIIASHTISSVMNTTVSKKYLELYKNDSEIKFTRELTRKIQAILKTRLQENTWLSPSTKENALQKLNNMVFAIGYRDKFVDDPDCDFDDFNDYHNNVKYLDWLLNKFKKDVNKKIHSNKYWLVNEEMNVFNVNAFYNNVENELILPNALLQKPMVDISKDITYNLAHIGFAIAHEMIHAFDVDGSNFDHNGELHFWWTDGDINKYKKLQQNVIEQYRKVAKQEGIHIDPQLTLNENIADISALHIIEDTLEEYLNTNGIYGDNQHIFFKKLYTYFAQQWRSLMTSDKETAMIMIDEHSLARHRVNCVLMRSKKFQQIYNITNNDGMYYSLDINTIW